MVYDKWVAYWFLVEVKYKFGLYDLEASGSSLFLFVKQEKDQRSLDINTAKCMLGLLLGKIWPLFPVFHQFLEVPNCYFMKCMFACLELPNIQYTLFNHLCNFYLLYFSAHRNYGAIISVSQQLPVFLEWICVCVSCHVHHPTWQCTRTAAALPLLSCPLLSQPHFRNFTAV
jgi:hypothetical protein